MPATHSSAHLEPPSQFLVKKHFFARERGGDSRTMLQRHALLAVVFLLSLGMIETTASSSSTSAFSLFSSARNGARDRRRERGLDAIWPAAFVQGCGHYLSLRLQRSADTRSCASHAAAAATPHSPSSHSVLKQTLTFRARACFAVAMAAAYSVQPGQFSPAKARNVLGWGRRETLGRRQTSTAMFISRRERERLAKGEQKLSRKERERRLAEAQESAGAAAGQDLAASPGGDAANQEMGMAEISGAEASDSVDVSELDDESSLDDDLEIDIARGTGGKGVWSQLYGDVLPAWLIHRLEVSGFMEPTAVQAEAIDAVVCQGRDALVQAYTGSGKTLAFLIPLFAVLEHVRGMDNTKRRLAGVQAVVVAPTRELAMQLTKVARQLAAGCPDTALYVMSVSSDAKAKRQRVWLKADPPQVVIGDAESLLKLCEAGTMRTGSIRFLVVDEVDACFNSAQTKGDLNRLLSRYLTSRKTTGDVEQRRTIFASATVREHAHFLQTCEKNKWLYAPLHVYVDPSIKVPPSLTHSFVTTDVPLLRHTVVLDICLAAARSRSTTACTNSPTEQVRQMHVEGAERQGGGAGGHGGRDGAAAVVLVFADETKESWNGLEAQLREALGDQCFMVLEANLGSSGRTRIMQRFRHQIGHRVLLASDMAARGLDVPDITHVVNFDLPKDSEVYCHRAGRAGRFGRAGEVLCVLAEEEVFVLERYANALQIQVREADAQGQIKERGRIIHGCKEEEEEEEEVGE